MPGIKPPKAPTTGNPKGESTTYSPEMGPAAKGPTVDETRVAALGGAVDRRAGILTTAQARAEALHRRAAEIRRERAEEAARLAVQRKAAPAPAGSGPGPAAAPGPAETAAEEAKIRAEASQEFTGMSVGTKEWTPKGGGRRGSPVVAKPPPPVPGVAGREPSAALSALAALPPKQILGAMGGVATAATTSVGKKQKALATSPPSKQIAEGPAGPGPPPAKPVVNTTFEQITPTGGAEPEAVGGEESVDAPPIELSGEADPANVEAQEAAAKAAATAASSAVKTGLTKPRGDDKLHPKVKAQTVKPPVPAAPGRVEVTAETVDQEAASIVAFQEKPGELNSAVAKGSGEASKAEADCAKQEVEKKKESDTEIKKAEDDHAKKLKEEEDKGRKEVEKERKDASEKHDKLLDDHTKDSGDKRASTITEVNAEKTRGDAEASRQVKEANDRIGDEKRKGEEEARKAEEAENKKAEEGGWLSDLAKGAEYLWDAVSSAVSAVWEAVKTAVAGIVESVVSAVGSLLKGVWNTIKNLVSAALEALKKLASVLLDALKALIDSALALIDAAIEGALAALQALADAFPGLLGELLGKLVTALGALYDGLKLALQAAIEAVKSAVKAIVSWARSAIAALGMLAALVKDVAADPSTWFSNLGASASDGIRNHLWGALKAAVKGWWNGKVTGLLNAPAEMLKLLSLGGITMAMVITMAWEFVKAAIPEMIIQKLIEKVVAALAVGAGTALLLLRALEAAWNSIDAIVGAIGKFFGYLQSVKGGGSGPQFAGAVGSAAVAVLEFVSNFLLSGLGEKLKPLKDKLQKLAKKIGDKIMALTRRKGDAKVKTGERDVLAAERGDPTPDGSGDDRNKDVRGSTSDAEPSRPGAADRAGDGTARERARDGDRQGAGSRSDPGDPDAVGRDNRRDGGGGDRDAGASGHDRRTTPSRRPDEPGTGTRTEDRRREPPPSRSRPRKRPGGGGGRPRTAPPETRSRRGKEPPDAAPAKPTNRGPSDGRRPDVEGRDVDVPSQADIRPPLGGQLDAVQIRDLYGMPIRNQQGIQRICDEENIRVLMRPTNPHAARLLERGALPKPPEIKAKTIDELDVYLGFRKQDIGKVGFKEPKLPKRKPAGMSDEQWSQVQARYLKRKENYDDYRAKMKSLTKQGGPMRIRINPRTGVVTERSTGRNYTGDHDIFEIYGADGKPLRGEELDRIIKKMEPYGVQHGPHLQWDPDPVKEAENRKMYEAIIREHSPASPPGSDPTSGGGGIPLIDFSTGAPPKTSLHGP